MTSDEIRRALKDEPFVPFSIVTSSGRSYDVDHPELVAIAPQGRLIAVYSKDDRAFAHVDLRLVDVLEFRRRNGSKKKRRSA